MTQCPPFSCLLCFHPHLEKSDQLLGQEILALWREVGMQFPPEALNWIGENSAVVLWRCRRCGFEFFNPELAGGSRFYQYLDSPDYYSPNRPEFARTVRFANRRRLLRVLDVGCGSGAFLDQAKEAGCQTFGLELNPSAVEKARAKAHQISAQLLHDLPPEFCADGFDLITLFQVLEHVASPVAMIKQAAVHLRTGGYVSIAVPSKLGSYHWDPAEWPPHHISRWRRKDFETLAASTNLHLVHSGCDLLLGSAIKPAMLMRNRLAAVLGKRPSSRPDLWPDWFFWAYRKTGMKFIAPRWGSSTYAYLQKP